MEGGFRDLGSVSAMVKITKRRIDYEYICLKVIFWNLNIALWI
jgi:hypothetical protein